jgi:hypothetical protein
MACSTCGDTPTPNQEGVQLPSTFAALVAAINTPAIVRHAFVTAKAVYPPFPENGDAFLAWSLLAAAGFNIPYVPDLMRLVLRLQAQFLVVPVALEAKPGDILVGVGPTGVPAAISFVAKTGSGAVYVVNPQIETEGRRAYSPRCLPLSEAQQGFILRCPTCHG